MPTIIVQSNASTEQQDSTASVLLLEDVQPEHLASDHHVAQLIQRPGWAATDAKDAEDSLAGVRRTGVAPVLPAI